MKNLLFFLIVGLIVSCSAESPNQENNLPKADEMVDLRIFSNGDIRFNGEMTTESGLPSHIESLMPSTTTKARIIFDEKAPTGVVHKTLRLLHENKITNIYSKMLSSADFKHHNQSMVHIDVLSSEKILFRGIELHPEDLRIGLKNSNVNQDSEFIFTVSEKASMGTVFDLQKTLAANNFTKITHQDVSKYYH